MLNLDASDLLVVFGIVVLAAGLVWVHPGWLIAAVGLGILSRSASRSS